MPVSVSAGSITPDSPQVATETRQAAEALRLLKAHNHTPRASQSYVVEGLFSLGLLGVLPSLRLFVSFCCLGISQNKLDMVSQVGAIATV